MKATIKISVMLMAMTIGTLAASAQSAKRGTPHSTQQRKSSSAVSAKSQRGQTNAPGRTKQSTTTKNTIQRSHINHNEARQKPNIHSTQKSNRVRYSSPKTSTSNHRNPKSNYREANKTVHVGKSYKDPKTRYTGSTQVNRSHTTVVRNDNTGYSNKHYYYPEKRVKIHVHPVTYHNHYKVVYYPAHRDIIWTRRMNNYYIGLYPGYAWRYPIGYRIQTISAFEARYNIGEVSRVYGRVYGTWYNRETDDLLLFFGGEFPNQEFTIVVPGHDARRYSWRPERYFLGQHVMATGLITSFDGRPEIVIKKRHQLDVY